MKEEKIKTLIIGIGNSGRSDDGLGWAFLDSLSDLNQQDFDMEYRYQLQVEDAELLCSYECVIFVDAHRTIFQDGFTYEKCIPKNTHEFSSHELSPNTIVFLTNSLYNKFPEAMILGISGQDFDLNIGMSPLAKSNHDKALRFFNNKIKPRYT